VMKVGENLVRRLQTYASRPWYPPLLALMTALDHLVVFIPTDGLLITSVMATPRKWVRNFLWVTAGSMFGTLVLAWVVSVYGVSLLEWIVPGIQTSASWQITEQWMERYGLWALFIVAALPIFQHPVIALAALAGLSFGTIFWAILPGRLLKFGLFAWIASHAPRAFARLRLFRSVRKEVAEVQALTRPGAGSDPSGHQ
jgi:membrane protein YqaA with SNARE-associated domain